MYGHRNNTQVHGESIFLHDDMTPAECDSFIDQSEAVGYEEAPINTADGVVMNKDVRDNTRLIVDDAVLTTQLWLRAQALIPQTIDGWHAIGLDERLRHYRYDPGQTFAVHMDGSFRRHNGEQSHLTFMVYPNDNFTGGETKFSSDAMGPRVSVRPERGAALVFEHAQFHQGAPVVDGRKYVLRTDVMFKQGGADYSVFDFSVVTRHVRTAAYHPHNLSREAPRSLSYVPAENALAGLRHRARDDGGYNPPAQSRYPAWEAASGMQQPRDEMHQNSAPAGGVWGPHQEGQRIGVRGGRDSVGAR